MCVTSDKHRHTNYWLKNIIFHLLESTDKFLTFRMNSFLKICLDIHFSETKRQKYGTNFFGELLLI